MSHLVQWYKHTIRPRLVFIPFVITWLLIFPIKAFRFKKQKRPLSLCIEAGSRGWDSIEYKELYQSAIEYLGHDVVNKVVIDKEQPYFVQLVSAVNQHLPTHYVYDPRTGSQHCWSALLESLRIALFLHCKGVVPIVILTDCAERLWRTQAAMVTASSGVVVTFISTKEIAPIFPHSRISGPSLMPFSQSTLSTLVILKETPHAVDEKAATFVGSLYEPRTSMLKAIDDGLIPLGFSLQTKGRLPGMPRVPDIVYWETLVHSAIGFTTADQVPQEYSDWTWIPHMVYRYLEVTAAGSLLVAPNVPGLARYFSPNIHFAEFDTVDDAVRVITYYLENPKERERVASEGHARACALISARTFWTSINAALGSQALI